MIRSISVAAAAALGIFFISANAATPRTVPVLTGAVTDLNGQPLAHVRLTIAAQPEAGRAAITTVFSGDDGRFDFPPDISATEKAPPIKAELLGYNMVSVTNGGGAPSETAVIMMPVANLAPGAPASAWFDNLPEGEGKQRTQLYCTGCHQFPSEKVKRFAEQAEAVAAARGDPTAKDEWRRMVRYEAWRSMVKYMRAKSYEIFPDETTIDVTKIPWKLVQAPEYALFNNHDEEVIAAYLADNLPRQFRNLSSFDERVPLIATNRTVIREYQLPDSSLVREAVMVRGSPFIWGADVQKNQLLRLDPRTGEQKWYPVPRKGASGPHTIIGDDKGFVWISMLEGDILGRFDPRTESWKIWPLGPTNAPPTKVFGDQAMVHDISFDTHQELAKDRHNYIWLTLIGTNRMARINPDTGQVDHYDAQQIEGRSGVNVSLYGTLLQSDGKCAWYSQLAGVVGCFNTETLRNEHIIEFSPGAGPRRMAIDDKDILWIPLYGAGQLVKYDTHTNKILKTYDLPDRASAPYTALWDRSRRLIWIGTTNNDALYAFDPRTETFKLLPLPRRQAYFRKLALDPGTDRLIASYGNIPTGSGPSMALIIELGDEASLKKGAR